MRWVNALLSRVPRPSLPRGVTAVLIAFVLCSLAGTGYHAQRLRSEALATHRTVARNVARLGEQQVTLVLQMIDRQLEARGADWLKQDPGEGMAFEPRLRADLAGFPALRSLAIVAADGRILASSSADARGLRLGRAEMAAVSGGGGPVALRISRPWAGRDLSDGSPADGAVDVRAGSYFFTVARRIGEADDGGYVVAVVNPDNLVQQFIGLVDVDSFVLSLSRYDGVMLAGTAAERVPPGLDQSREALFQALLADREIGLIDTARGTGAPPAILAYRASRLYPLVIQARIDHDAALADWRREMLNLATMGLGVLCFVVVLGAMVHRIQARREQEQAAARVEHELAARVFDAAFEGIVITDDARRILRVNKAFTRITGYREDEVRGRTPHVLSSGIHDDAFYAELWRTVARDGRWQGEIMNRRRDGDIYPEALVISSVTDEANKVCNYIGTFTDITERRRAEDALLSAKDAAEAASRAKSQFLATISHEIRTPMNAILGMAQLLMLPDLREADRVEYAKTLFGSGESLLALLNDVLDLSRVEAGRLDLNPTAMTPQLLIEETAALFSEAAQRKGLTIVTHWSGRADERYRADPLRVRQMLSNLLSNAIKFSANGALHVDAEVLARTDAYVELRFSVTDNGVGIPREKLAQLFQPFSQVDGSTTRAAAGSGLGLSIVRSLALLMDGDVGVRSEPGRGSCFWFRIRVAPLAAAPVPAAAPLPVPSGPDAAAHEALILVVDDSPTNATLVETMLRYRGYRVAVATDGQQAVAALDGGATPDVILMDCRMPVMDGFQATRRIREQELATGRPRVPIVALTANAFEENREACLGCGMDDFLTKPVVLADLLARLARWLPRNEPVAERA